MFRFAKDGLRIHIVQLQLERFTAHSNAGIAGNDIPPEERSTMKKDANKTIQSLHRHRELVSSIQIYLRKNDLSLGHQSLPVEEKWVNGSGFVGKCDSQRVARRNLP